MFVRDHFFSYWYTYTYTYSYSYSVFRYSLIIPLYGSVVGSLVDQICPWGKSSLGTGSWIVLFFLSCCLTRKGGLQGGVFGRVWYTHTRVDLKCVTRVLGRVLFGYKCPTKCTFGCLFSLGTVIFLIPIKTMKLGIEGIYMFVFIPVDPNKQ